MNISPQPSVVIVNTLGGALHHYTAELKDVLSHLEHPGSVTVRSIDEPSRSGKGSIGWLRDYAATLRELRKVRRQEPSTRIIVTWPVIGFLDAPLIWALFGARATLVVHDTVPLVKSRGYGRVSQALAALVSRRVQIVVHSVDARRDIINRRIRTAATVVAHPILDPHDDESQLEGDGVIVRVLGQYKPDRDLVAMAGIARSVPSTVELEAVGRRWPAVTGWTVRDEFVSESELDRLISTSSAVVIPYSRFYQSGVAIRCLEHSTPVVGPAGTSLVDLLGEDSPLLVGGSSGESWADAIERAVEMGPKGASELAARWRARALREWSDWMKS